MDLNPAPGWGLRPVEAADQAVLTPYLATLREPLSDYTFSQVFTWRNSLRILWRTLHGHLCVFANGTGDLTLLLPPLSDGSGDGERALAAAFELMDDYNAQHKVPDRSRVEYASEELLARFGGAGRLDVSPMGHDYVYDVARMIDLAGGDLSSKRQAKNRFLRLYKHRTEAYDAARHQAECLSLLDRWKSHQDESHVSEPGLNAVKRQKETLATELALRQADALGLKGMVVYVADEQTGVESIRGFTFGEALGADQSSIVIEKTDLEVKGLAQFIFSEFCRTTWADRPLVNAGDDWGVESLAWTKQSYRPVKLLKKYVLKLPAKTRVALTPPTVAPDAVATPAPLAPTVPTASEPRYTVRPARAGDVAAAAALESACFDAYRLSQRQLTKLLTNPRAIFRVAERDGQGVVGTAVALVRHHRNGMSGRLYSLAVRDDCRGLGIGRELFQSLVAELEHRGVRRMFLEVEQTNTGAIHLYERQGFRAVGTLPDYYGPGRPGVHMLREVPQLATVRPAA